MPMGVESERVGNPIITTREPVGPKRSGEKGSMGDQAFIDACIIVGLAYAILVFLAFSLRSHNV